MNSDHSTHSKFEGEFSKLTLDDNTIEESSSDKIHNNEGENNAMIADRSTREVPLVSDTIQLQPSVPTESNANLTQLSLDDGDEAEEF